jgi:hypothetical protein
MKQLIDRLRSLESAATKGPWRLDGFDIVSPTAGTLINGNTKLVVGSPDYLCEEDETLIIELRNALPLLLDHIEKLEVALRKCEQNAGDVNMIGAIVEDAFEKKEWVTE